MEVSPKFYICIPRTPNFITCSGVDKPFSIAKFSDTELQKIGEQWTKNLIAEARKKRNRPTDGETK